MNDRDILVTLCLAIYKQTGSVATTIIESDKLFDFIKSKTSFLETPQGEGQTNTSNDFFLSNGKWETTIA